MIEEVQVTIKYQLADNSDQIEIVEVKKTDSATGLGFIKTDWEDGSKWDLVWSPSSVMLLEFHNPQPGA